MTSQWVERAWIRMGGYGRFRGEWVKSFFFLLFCSHGCKKVILFCLLLQENVDIYSTNEPQGAFHQRVSFCLDLYNQSVRVGTIFTHTLLNLVC